MPALGGDYHPFLLLFLPFFGWIDGFLAVDISISLPRLSCPMY